MAVTVGEVWTNAIQPLYAVPVLAIAGLHIRDIMRYCVIKFIVTGTIYLTALTLSKTVFRSTAKNQNGETDSAKATATADYPLRINGHQHYANEVTD